MEESHNTGSKVLAHDDSAVIKTLEMYQAIITRMAGNSADCKKWGLPLITAILAFVVKEQQYQLVWLAILAIAVFYYLDAYYLMLENRFRAGFSQAADKVISGTFTQKDLFQLKPAGSEKKFFLKAFTSSATWPVYFGLLVLSVFAYMWT
jgi:hypothetical protein